MTQNIEHATRAQIATFLPTALKKAIDFYISIKIAEEKDKDGKEKTPTTRQYKEYHDACKVGLAHIKLLLELAQWADLPGDHMNDENLEDLILEARKEINKNN
jgi:hypothetical protein